MDRAVFIKVHKAEGLIDLIVNDGQVEVVILRQYASSIRYRNRPADQRPASGPLLNCRHINDIGQTFHKRLHQILLFT